LRAQKKKPRKLRREPSLDKIGILIVAILEAARGAGMTAERAEAIYEDIMDHLKNLHDEGHDLLVRDLLVKWAPYAKSPS